MSDQLFPDVGQVRLATEEELAAVFTDCALGSMPPFGNLYNLPVYVDASLAANQTICFQIDPQ